MRVRPSLRLTARLGIIALAAGLAATVAAQTPAIPTPPAVGTIHVADVHQPIYGFGGSQTYAGDSLADFPRRDAVYKALFQDLKIDIYRLRNYNGYPGQQAKFGQVTREFAGGALKWGGDPKTRGGKAPVRLMFTSWSPPPALKSNGLASGRSDGTDKGLANATLRQDAAGNFAYGPYADWWLDSLKTFKTLTGVYPDYIALQNELEFPATYEGCLFLPTEGTNPKGDRIAGYDRALASVSDRLTGALGASAPKIVGPETFSLKTSAADPNHVPAYINPKDAAGKSDLTRLFGVSFHLYGAGAAGGEGGPDPARFEAGLNEVRAAYRTGGVDKPLFQTEFLEGDSLTAVAGIISDTFTEGDVSAYLVWIAARSVKQPGGYALVYYNPDDGSVERRERFYAVKAFSEFVGEGWHRVAAECSDPGIKFSAYIGPRKGDLVAVLVNPTNQPHQITLTPDGDAYHDAATAVYRSSEGETGEHWHELGALSTGNVVTLTPRSVVTIRFARPGSRPLP